MQPKKVIVKNKAGKDVTLNKMEQAIAMGLEQQIRNNVGLSQFFKVQNSALGFEIPITTLTTIVKAVSEQKFYTVAPAEFLPVRSGQGAWGQQLTTYLSYKIGGQFEDGIINTGGNNSRLSSATTGIEAKNVQIFNWAMENTWTLIEIQQAAKSGNWDLITALEESRKTDWDLGIQRVAFLGARGQDGTNGNCLGLLNQPGITNNLSIITQKISAMSSSQLKTFIGAIYEAYRLNCNRTCKPTHFAVPESDFNGMTTQVSADFPIKTVYELVLEAFVAITGNKDFKLLSLAYGDAAYNDLGVQRYALYNYDEKSLRMDLPVDYTNTMANTLNGFQFQNAAYGQFTGVVAYRPLEMLYFSY